MIFDLLMFNALIKWRVHDQPAPTILLESNRDFRKKKSEFDLKKIFRQSGRVNF